MDIKSALEAICSTGDGRCWYCDRNLPAVAEAVRRHWDVRRVAGEPAASLILICPDCQREKAELGEEGFLRSFSRRVLSAAQ